jgi:hypothetical protein
MPNNFLGPPLIIRIILIWRYSPIVRLQAFLSSAYLLQFLHLNILSASNGSISLLLGLPTDLLPSLYPFSAFLGAFRSFILNTWPINRSHLDLTFLVSSIHV